LCLTILQILQQKRWDVMDTACLSTAGLQYLNTRPADQRNDYIGRLTRAKHKETQEKRLAQMLDELKRGGCLHEDGMASLVLGAEGESFAV
jgi:hypothetical protein